MTHPPKERPLWAAAVAERLSAYRRRLYAYRQICTEAGIPMRQEDEGRLLYEWTFLVPDPADDPSAPMANVEDAGATS